MKLLVLYVSFSLDLEKLKNNLKNIKNFLKKKSLKNYDIYSVNNNPKILLNEKLKKDEKIFSRNNSYFDFGAWNFLFQKKKKNINRYDWVLLTNDTFDKDYSYHLKLFNKEMLSNMSGQKVALGHLDAYSNKDGFKKVSLHKKKSSYWLRSSFLLIDAKFFSKINSLIFFKKKKIFINNTTKINKNNIKISKNFYDQINFWLFGLNPNKKLSKNYRNQKKNFSKFYVKNKITTILNEFYLSRLIENFKFKIYDIEWLYFNKKKYVNPIKQIKYCANKRLIQNVKNP